MSRRRLRKYRGGPKGFNIRDPDHPGPAPTPPPPGHMESKEPGARKSRGQPWTQERMEQFCEEFRKHGLPGKAARAVGSSKRAVVRKREKDPEFDRMCREAWEAFTEETIRHVQQTAWDGKQGAIIRQDKDTGEWKVVGVETKWFPRIMELEARRVVPEYREKFQVELSGDQERPVAVDVTKLDELEAWKLRELLLKMRPEGEDGDD